MYFWKWIYLLQVFFQKKTKLLTSFLACLLASFLRCFLLSFVPSFLAFFLLPFLTCFLPSSLTNLLTYLLEPLTFLNHLLDCSLQYLPVFLIFFSLTLHCFWFPRGSISIHMVNSSSQREQRQAWSTFFSRSGLPNILIMVEPFETSRNYLTLIPPNTKSILVSKKTGSVKTNIGV